MKQEIVTVGLDLAKSVFQVHAIADGGVTAMLKELHERQGELPVHTRSALHSLAAQLRALANEIDRLEAQILAWHRTDETSPRRATIPVIGPITASAITVALANNTARIAWAAMSRKEVYVEPAA